MQFLYLTKPSNKGTSHTAQMLEEAADPEERAAIWIAATAFELMDKNVGNGVPRYASQLFNAASVFLGERFYLWHHAMRRRVPELLIPYTVLDSLHCDCAETVMGLIQMNVLMLKGSYSVLRYSSISDEEIARAKQAGKLRLRR